MRHHLFSLLWVFLFFPSFLGAATITWTGATNTNWNLGGNWDLARAPLTDDAILINSGAVDLDTDYTVGTGSLTIASGATLRVNGFSLAGASTSFGAGIIYNNGFLEFNGQEATFNTKFQGTGTVIVTGTGQLHIETHPDVTDNPRSFLTHLVIMGSSVLLPTITATRVYGNFTLDGGSLLGGNRNFTVDGTSSLNGSITAVDSVTFEDALTLTGNTTIIDASFIDFKNTVDGSFDLTLNSGTVNFDAAIGNSTGLNKLDISSTAGAITVDNPGNNFTAFAASTMSDSVTAYTQFDLRTDVISTGGGAVNIETDQNLSVSESINTGTGPLVLAAQGDIILGTTVAGSLSAGQVRLNASGGGGLSRVNSFPLFASSVHLQTDGSVGGDVGTQSLPIEIQGDSLLNLGSSTPPSLTVAYISHTGAGDTLTLNSLTMDASKTLWLATNGNLALPSFPINTTDGLLHFESGGPLVTKASHATTILGAKIELISTNGSVSIDFPIDTLNGSLDIETNTIVAQDATLQGEELNVSTITNIGTASINLPNSNNDFNSVSLRNLDNAGSNLNTGTIIYRNKDSFTIDGNGIKTRGTATLSTTDPNQNLSDAVSNIINTLVLDLNGGDATLDNAPQITRVSATNVGTLRIENEITGSILGDTGIDLAGVSVNLLVLESNDGHVTDSLASSIANADIRVDRLSDKNIILDHPNNDFNNIQFEGHTVTVHDQNALTLGLTANGITSRVEENLSLVVGGAVNQVDSIEVNNAVEGRFSIEATGFDVNLPNTGNKFSKIVVEAEDLSIYDADGTCRILKIDATGNVHLRGNTIYELWDDVSENPSGDLNINLELTIDELPTPNVPNTTLYTNNHDLTVDGDFIGGELRGSNEILFDGSSPIEEIRIGGDFRPMVFDAPGTSRVILNQNFGLGFITVSNGISEYTFNELSLTGGALLDTSGNARLIAPINLTGNFLIDDDKYFEDNGNEIAFVGETNQDVSQQFRPGGSDDFANITVENTGTGETILSLIDIPGTENFEVTGMLMIKAASVVGKVNQIIMGGHAFDINALDNNGRLELSGTQDAIGQTIGSMDTDSGILRYSSTQVEDGDIHLSEFYHLEIDDQAQDNTYRFKTNSTIWGNLTIIDGVLDASDVFNLELHLYGNMENVSTGGGGDAKEDAFEPGTSIITLEGAAVQNVLGSWKLSTLKCEWLGPGTKIIQIGTAGTHPSESDYPANGVDTLIFQMNSTFFMKGADATTLIELRPFPTDTPYWQISTPNAGFTAEMEHVDLFYSKATPQNIILPDDVNRSPAAADNPGWVVLLDVQASHTVDGILSVDDGTGTIINIGQQNGKLNALVLELGSFINQDFSGFAMAVEGYTIKEYYRSLLGTDIVVALEEIASLDTGVKPKWTLTNSSIKTSTGVEKILIDIGTEREPDDGAAPIIAHTLAYFGGNEVFLRFSEPIITGIPSITLPSGYSPVGRGGLLFQEEYLFSGPILSANNLLTNSIILNGGIAGTLEDGGGNDLSSYNHRITDIALGIEGNGIVQPVFAKNDALGAGTNGPGTVNQFDGSEFLEPRDITLQAFIEASATVITTPENDVKIQYNSKVPSRFLSASGLWLPYDDERWFSGLTPYPLTGLNADSANPPISSTLIEYSLLGTDTRLEDGNDVDFFFVIENLPFPAVFPEILVASIPMASTDWYRRVDPWRWKSRKILAQAGAVSILNNVIRPQANECAYLKYNLAESGMVRIQVFDLAGGLVEVLQDDYQGIGEYSVPWCGRNTRGAEVARGIFFIRVVAPGNIDETRKVLVVK